MAMPFRYRRNTAHAIARTAMRGRLKSKNGFY
jgi:hypothetical protein